MLNSQERLDLAFQALADPTRRAIVARLVQGPASVGEIARPLSISLPGVLQHLGVLEASGLVVTQKVGRVRTCRIEASAVAAAEAWLAGLRGQWERSLDRLTDYLATTQDGDKDHDP